MDEALKTVQLSTTGQEISSQGLIECKLHAGRRLEDYIPLEYHFGYVFSKQDVYRPRKIGLQFHEGPPPGIQEAAHHPGNCNPAEVESRGTRMCTGGDKLLQSVAQSVTAPIKSVSKQLPLMISQDQEFEELLTEIRAIDKQVLYRVSTNRASECRLSKASSRRSWQFPQFLLEVGLG